MTKADHERSASRKLDLFPRTRQTLSLDVCGPVFVMFWHQTPSLDDVRRVLDDARDARLAHGEPMLQLVVISNDAFAMPPSDVRAEMAANMKEMDENFDGHVLVLGALGFVGAAIHALASTLALAGNRKPGRTKICRGYDEGVKACAELAAPGAVDAGALRRVLGKLEELAPR